LLHCIGRGSYGEVWLARNVLGDYRAAKVVYRRAFEHDRPYEREFEGIRKFEPISRLDESQVDILHVGRNDDARYFYYVMELADDSNAERRTRNAGSTPGTSGIQHSESRIQNRAPRIEHPESYVPHTLKFDLYQQSRLPVDECIRIGLALTTALEHLHGHGLVHRDIKPSNIIFVNDVPKLADIGLVATMDTTMSFVGTSGFLPPEGPGTPQGDIYSLGKVLYEMAMGRDRQEFPRLPPDLGASEDARRLLELNVIILKACHTDPRERYESAQAMAEELSLLQQGCSIRRRRLWHRRRGVAFKLGIAATMIGLISLANTYWRASIRGHTPNPEAAWRYEMGQWHYSQLTGEHHRKALEYLTQAIKADPEFVKPYGELTAICIWGRKGVFASQDELIRTAKEIADKLLALDPKLAEGHTALSFWKFTQRDWGGAEEAIRRAIELNPKYPIARDIYTFYLSMQGRIYEAHHQAEQSRKLGRTARTTGVVSSWPFIAARQFDEAITQLQQVIKLDRNYPEAHNDLGRCYEAQSKYVAAIEAWRTCDLLLGHDAVKVNTSYTALRQAYDASGEQGYFRKYIELIEADRLIPEAERLFYEDDLAGCYARLGEKEKALDILEKNFDHKLKYEPLYDSLHNDLRFKALLKRAGLEERSR
jgi:tetratricopeptide (TPR) repeat protein